MVTVSLEQELVETISITDVCKPINVINWRSLIESLNDYHSDFSFKIIQRFQKEETYKSYVYMQSEFGHFNIVCLFWK